MDLNDIWQQHKAWILGIVGGLIVFLVGNTYISRRFDPTEFSSSIAKSRRALKASYYGKTQRRNAREDLKSLEEELAVVGRRSFFTLREQFDLDGKGDPTFHYIDTESRVQRDVRQVMDVANVEFSATQLGLPPNNPVVRDEIQATLVALDVVDDALARLVEASRQVQEALPDARGLASVDQIRIAIVPPSRKRSSGDRRRNNDIELGSTVKVSMRFTCDPMTLQAYLASCEGTDLRRPLLVDADLVAKSGDEQGDPMEVRITHVAIRPEEE